MGTIQRFPILNARGIERVFKGPPFVSNTEPWVCIICQFGTIAPTLTLGLQYNCIAQHKSMRQQSKGNFCLYYKLIVDLMSSAFLLTFYKSNLVCEISPLLELSTSHQT